MSLLVAPAIKRVLGFVPQAHAMILSLITLSLMAQSCSSAKRKPVGESGDDSQPVEFVDLPSKDALPGELYRIPASKPLEDWSLDVELNRGRIVLHPDDGLGFFAYNPDFTDEHCRLLAKIPRLASISLFRGGSMTAYGAALLANCSTLRNVELTLTRNLDAWTVELARNTALERVYIHEADDRLTDDQVSRLATLPSLRFLTLQQCWNVKGDFLARGFSKLESLSLVQIPHDTGEDPTISTDLERYIAALPDLKNLTLAQFTFLRELRLDLLLSCPKLEEIALNCNGYSGICCRIGFPPSASLKVFRFTRNWMGELDKTTLNALPLLLPQLRELDLSGCVLTPGVAPWVERFKRLEQIDLSETEVGAETVALISAHPKIEKIVLRECKTLSEQNVEYLRRNYPSKEFIHP